jgi:hypothetical protein
MPGTTCSKGREGTTSSPAAPTTTISCSARAAERTFLDFVDGADQIGVSGFGAGFNTAAEIVNAASQVGGNVEIALGAVRVIITGFSLANFDSSDVAFAIA